MVQLFNADVKYAENFVPHPQHMNLTADGCSKSLHACTLRDSTILHDITFMYIPFAWLACMIVHLVLLSLLKSTTIHWSCSTLHYIPFLELGTFVNFTVNTFTDYF